MKRGRCEKGRALVRAKAFIKAELQDLGQKRKSKTKCKRQWQKAQEETKKKKTREKRKN